MCWNNLIWFTSQPFTEIEKLFVGAASTWIFHTITTISFSLCVSQQHFPPPCFLPDKDVVFLYLVFTSSLSGFDPKCLFNFLWCCLQGFRMNSVEVEAADETGAFPCESPCSRQESRRSLRLWHLWVTDAISVLCSQVEEGETLFEPLKAPKTDITKSKNSRIMVLMTQCSRVCSHTMSQYIADLWHVHVVEACWLHLVNFLLSLFWLVLWV